MNAPMSELQQMRSHAYSLPAGPARFAALDVVLRHADAAGETKFAFDTRMSAMNDHEQHGDPTRLFLAFSWCLSTFDNQPEVVGPEHNHSLLWRYKWVVHGLCRFPEVPLQRTQAVLDDMQRRYQLGGHSLHAVHQHRWEVAIHTGDLTAAEHWYRQMMSAQRDGLSDCAGCIPTAQVFHLATTGHDEDAIRVGESVKPSGCWSQPQSILTTMLAPLLRTRNYDKAVYAYRDAYRRMSSQIRHMSDVADTIWFCGVTGNEARGLEMIDRHTSWLTQAPSPFDAMQFAASAALVLRRLTEAGHTDLSARRDDLITQARHIAARFDHRNGNQYQSTLVEQRIFAEPIASGLPLTVLKKSGADAAKSARDKVLSPHLERLHQAAAAGDRPQTAMATFDIACILRDEKRWDDAIETAEEALLALGRAQMDDTAAQCRYLLWELYTRTWQHHDRALANLEALLELPVLPKSVPPRAELLEKAGDRMPNATAVPKFIAAASLHHGNHNWPEEHRLLEKALSVARHLSGGEPQLLIERLDLLTAAHSDLDQAQTNLSIGYALTAAGQHAEALDRTGQSITDYTSRDDRENLFSALTLRARLLLRLGQLSEAETHAHELRQNNPDAWEPKTILILVIRQQGRHADAKNLMDELGIDEYDLEVDDDYSPPEETAAI